MHNIGLEVNLNVTPYVNFGHDNELIIMDGPKATIKDVTHEFHEKGTYP